MSTAEDHRKAAELHNEVAQALEIASLANNMAVSASKRAGEFGRFGTAYEASFGAQTETDEATMGEYTDGYYGIAAKAHQDAAKAHRDAADVLEGRQPKEEENMIVFSFWDEYGEALGMGELDDLQRRVSSLVSLLTQTGCRVDFRYETNNPEKVEIWVKASNIPYEWYTVLHHIAENYTTLI